MNIEETDLSLILDALELAQEEIHNRIATCPDVDEYAESIDLLEKEKEALKNLVHKLQNPQG